VELYIGYARAVQGKEPMRAEKLFPILSVTAETIMIVPRTDRTAGSERATCILIHPSVQLVTVLRHYVHYQLHLNSSHDARALYA
jgi:hypothetical protein